MSEVVAELRSVPDTEAALGWAGGHTVVVDRPEGVAGGAGLGFNGGQMLALAIGGCLCNDLRYASHELDIAIREISVRVALELDGRPLIVRRALVSVDCRTQDGGSAATVIDHAVAMSTVANSIGQGFPVQIARV